MLDLGRVRYTVSITVGYYLSYCCAYYVVSPVEIGRDGIRVVTKGVTGPVYESTMKHYPRKRPFLYACVEGTRR